MPDTVRYLVALFCLCPLLAVAADKKQEEPSPEPPSPPGRSVVIKTSLGTIEIELFEKQAPITVKNFLRYVDDRFYDNLIFHRVIDNFMIQGGGFEKGLAKEKQARPAIKNESNNGLSNSRGTIAMARTSVVDSATSQFFINLKDNAFLDFNQTTGQAGYCVFGKVISGMDVVDKIARVRTQKQGIHNDVPVEDVVILSARRGKK